MFEPPSIRAFPLSILWHTFLGEMPGYLTEQTSRTGWLSFSHRGVQMLEKLTIPKKQKGYIFSPKWEMRLNSAFDDVLQACRDTHAEHNSKPSWITPTLMRGSSALHKLGYAYSYETWLDGKLVGGIWGYQLGSFISIASAFHRAPNASKAAFARGQLLMQQRGFTLVDWYAVPTHMVNFGVEWMPQAQFQQKIIQLAQQPRSLADGLPTAELPPLFKKALPLVRLSRAAGRRAARLKSRLRRKSAAPLGGAAASAPAA